MTSPQPVGQQKVGVGGQGSLGSTWSDPSVNISLDFLSAGLNPSLTPPTLNSIIQQQGIIKTVKEPGRQQCVCLIEM